MVTLSIEIGMYIALPLAILGAVLIYRDAQLRGMETADMWAVGFFVAFFVLPVIGGLLVLALYLQKRNARGGRPYIDPER